MMSRKYLIEYRDGCQEIVCDAFDISDARLEAERLYDHPIKTIRIIPEETIRPVGKDSSSV
jgi:hypothetical protein